MQYLKNGILFTVAALAFTSCSEENPWQGGQDEGGIRLQLSTDGKVFAGGDGTRAGEGIKIPEASEFKLRMAKTDGSVSKVFESIEEFEKEGSFPIGEYYIDAFYGDIAKEGFELPYFFGRETVQVRPASVSDVEITARLANSMVSLSFSEAFKTEYPTYSATLSTTGAPVFVAQNEDRVAYVQPGDVNIALSLTNASGKSVTFTPASFVAQPQHRYNVKFNLEPGSASGNSLILKVIFDDNVESEVVEVDLSDDFFNSPAPEVRPMGFTDGETFSIIENEKVESKPRFHVFAFGGLKEANFTVSSTGLKTAYTPAFGNSVNLIGADAAKQAQLEAEGVVASGFFKNPDKMAILDVTGFLSKLPYGTHTLTLNAVDAYTRTSEIVTMVVNVGELSINAEVIEKPVFYGDEMNVYVTSNSNGIKDKISFEVSNGEGVMKPAVIKSVEDVTVRSESNYRYKYVLGIEKNDATKIDVNVKNGSAVVKSFSVEKALPEYTVEADAFARHILLKVTPTDSSDLATIVNALSVFIGNSEVQNGNITRYPSEGIIKVGGFSSATTYSSVQVGIGKTLKKDVSGFTTETEADVPNGDFSKTTKTIDIASINAGGQYKYGATTMQNKSSILVSEPESWTSINQKTCYSGSDPMNTWFVVPSTMATSDGKVVVRSVAYDHKGTLPALDNHGLAVRKKYSRNAPSTFSGKSAGELFLGSYSFDGTERREEGISFTSRPSAVTFDYDYVPVANETAEIEIKVFDVNKNVIVTKNEKISKGSGSKTVSVTDYPFGKKAASISIRFVSTSGENVSVSVPSDLEDVTNTTSLSGQTIATNSYKSLCVGSVLTVDNVKLGYDQPAARSAKQTSKTVNKRRK